ncbi:hypothetical protein ACVR0S_07880 [Streptococcus dentapri]
MKLTNHGAVEMDNSRQTSVPNVFAVGDINGNLPGLFRAIVDADSKWILGAILSVQSPINSIVMDDQILYTYFQ